MAAQPRIVSRREWGAATTVAAGRHVPPSSRRRFVIHWPGSPVGANEPAVVRSIEAFHARNITAAAAPAYNYLIGNASGLIFEGCGRDVRGPANGTNAANIDGWSCCVLQPVNGRLSQLARNSTRRLYQWLCEVAGRQLAAQPHSAIVATSCPGDELRAWIRADMPAQLTPPPQPSREDMMIATANAGADGRGNSHVWRLLTDGSRVDYVWRGQGSWSNAGGGWEAGMTPFARAPDGHRLGAIVATNDRGVLTLYGWSRNDGSMWVVHQSPGSTGWSGGGPGRIAAFRHFAR